MVYTLGQNYAGFNIFIEFHPFDSNNIGIGHNNEHKRTNRPMQSNMRPNCVILMHQIWCEPFLLMKWPIWMCAMMKTLVLKCIFTATPVVHHHHIQVSIRQQNYNILMNTCALHACAFSVINQTFNVPVEILSSRILG